MRDEREKKLFCIFSVCLLLAVSRNFQHHSTFFFARSSCHEHGGEGEFHPDPIYIVKSFSFAINLHDFAAAARLLVYL